MRLEMGDDFRAALNNLKMRLAEPGPRADRLRRRVTQRQLEEALRRLEGGTYGICARCFLVIPKAELLMRPYTELCAECRRRARTA